VAAAPGLATGRAGAQAAPQGAASAPAAPESATEAIKRRLSEGLGTATKYLFSFVSNTLAAIAAFILLIFLAMYIGAEPEVYRGWMLAAVPATSRAQVRIVLDEVSTVLRKWLITQLVAMVVIGTVSFTVLMLLGVKAAFALGFIAGLMEFIPTVGPILSAVPAILMGFVDSPEKALAVGLAYWGIQFVENNLLIPYLMRGEMDLPPAITIIAQTLMTLVFGFLGLMVAVPLTAAVLVPLRMMAERENAREKELVRFHKSQRDLMHADVKPDDVMEVANTGPEIPSGSSSGGATP
jgi:predicted PurR-regulated permease PerM